jgi:tRNA G18 (ribose-2'-O)-methylase SpoU
MQKKEITIILDRLRSAHNVGNIFRIAEAIGAKEIIACKLGKLTYFAM